MIFPNLKVKRIIGGEGYNPYQYYGSALKFLWTSHRDNLVNNGEFTDVIGSTGQSDDLASTPNYASDFSLGKQGWIDFGSRLQPVGAIDGIYGEDDVVRINPNQAASIQHYMYNPTNISWVIGKSYRFRMKYYIEGANSQANGVTAGCGVNTRDFVMSEWGTTDAWVQTGWYYMTMRVSTGLYILSNQNGNTSHSATTTLDDNIIYLKDIEIEDMTAPNLQQPTISNMPSYPGANGGIQSDGIAEYLTADWNVIKDDTKGFWFYRFRDSGAGGNVVPVYYWKTSGARAAVAYIGTDHILKFVISGQSTLEFNTISRGSTITLIAGADTVNSYLYDGGVAQTLTSGTDLAYWMANVGDDTGTLGVMGNPIIPSYDEMELFVMGYVGGVDKPTAAEAVSLTNWMNSLQP